MIPVVPALIVRGTPIVLVIVIGTLVVPALIVMESSVVGTAVIGTLMTESPVVDYLPKDEEFCDGNSSDRDSRDGDLHDKNSSTRTPVVPSFIVIGTPVALALIV